MNNSNDLLIPIICSIITIVIIILVLLFQRYEEKWNIKQKLGHYLTINPTLKTIIFIITVVVTGILCSAFVTEINNVNYGIQWKYFYKYDSFYILLVIVAIDFFYNWINSSYDYNEIMKFSDDEFLKAYIRKNCAREIIDKVKSNIKDLDKVDVKKLFPFCSPPSDIFH